MKFIHIFLESDYIDSALKWLKNKFGDKYNFKHSPSLNNIDKSYAVSIDGKEFTIVGKKYDTNGDGEKDTVLFKIIIDEEKDQNEF